MDVSLARGPTPVEDLEGEATARSRDSTGSAGVADLMAGGSSTPMPLPHANATQALQILDPGTYGSPTGGDAKPKLYMCDTVDDAAEWQAMGVYDDEDLEEPLLLLLHCPKGSHYLWLGSEYAEEHAAPCADEAALLEWACREVAAGENSRWVDVFPCDVCLMHSGEESDAFWDAFNDGF